MKQARPAPVRLRLAADIGGTFTDIAVFDEKSGKLTFGKALSTPQHLVEGISAGVAKAGSDYTATAGTLTFPAGVNPPAPQKVEIPITTDAFGEPDETFKLFFGSNRNASLAGDTNPTLTIKNDDGAAPVITIDPIPPKAEGDSGPSAMTVTLKATNTTNG